MVGAHRVRSAMGPLKSDHKFIQLWGYSDGGTRLMLTLISKIYLNCVLCRKTLFCWSHPIRDAMGPPHIMISECRFFIDYIFDLKQGLPALGKILSYLSIVFILITLSKVKSLFEKQITWRYAKKE